MCFYLTSKIQSRGRFWVGLDDGSDSEKNDEPLFGHGVGNMRRNITLQSLRASARLKRALC